MKGATMSNKSTRATIAGLLSLCVVTGSVNAQEVVVKKADGPKIGCEKPIHDFGENWKGTKISHSFEIKNTGATVLKITSVKPGCGCTVASEFTKEIPPGGTGVVPLTIDTNKVKTPYTKAVTVMSNDPATGQYKVTLKGTLKDRFIIDPAKGTNFGRIRPDDALERKLTLTNNMGQPVELSLPSAKHGMFNLELVEKEKGQVYELMVRSNPPYGQPSNRRNVKLQTNLDDQATVDLTLAARVPAWVETTPASIQVQKAEARATTKNVRVRFNSKEPREIIEATTDVKGGEVSIKQITTNHYDLTVSLPANYAPPTNGNVVKIKTNEPKKTDVEVKIAKRAAAKQRTKPAMQLSGKQIPDATFELAKGGAISTKDLKDDATVMFFYASWCGFCKKTLPQLEKMKNELTGKPVKFVAISMDQLKEDGASGRRAKSRQEVVDQWKTLGVSFDQALDKSKAGGSKFKVQSFPTMFLVSKSGKVERAYIGAGAVQSGQLRKEIDDLVAGKKLAAQKIEAAPAKKRRPALDLAGKPTPPASFVLASGESISTNDMKEDATVVFFYASWCGFCKRTLPQLDKMANELEGKSARFLAVSMDQLKEDGATGGRAKTKQFVLDQWKSLGVSLPQAFDKNKDGSTKFKVQSFPTMFLLSKSGKVERAYVGAGSVQNGQLRKEIDDLLAGKKLAAQPVAPAAAQPKKNRRPALELAGKRSPSAAFPAASGDGQINLAATDAKATVALFYTSWCGHCKKALPKMNEMVAGYAGKPVKFVGVNQDQLKESGATGPRAKSKAEVTKQWQDLGVSFPQHLDPTKAGRNDFKVVSYPTMFLIDGNGKIEQVYVGGNAVKNGQLAKDIDRLLTK
jgi:thiol-disulfide isomerase/thioredoxin